MSLQQSRIIDSRHPNFMSNVTDWEKWRLTYRGGEEFRNRYLERFTSREDTNDFEARKRITPIPAFAKAAINRIRNSIFQRMHDITGVTEAPPISGRSLVWIREWIVVAAR